MADLVINIGQPALVSNQGFRVEYRLLGSPAWVLFGVITSNTATITGLTAGGEYEIRITFLQSLSPLIECPAVIETYLIPAVVTCIDFEVAITASGNHYVIEIDASGFGSPYNPPCGGYEVIYTGPESGNFTVPDFLVTPSFSIPVSLAGVYHVTIQAIDCNGVATICYDEDVPTPEPVCTPSTFDIPVALYGVALNYPTFELTIVLNQSVPYQNPITVSYAQSQAVFSGVPDPGGTIQVTGQNIAQQTIVITVTPNSNVAVSNGMKAIRYSGSVTNGCGGTLPFKAQIEFAT